MKTGLKLLTLLFATLIMSCGGKEEKKTEKFSYDKKAPATEKPVAKEEVVPASKRVDLTNKGIGPITSVTLDAEVNQEMATRGADIFKKNCTACHRTDKKFIGPAPKGVLDIRTPEWVMNMILNPEVMVKEDPLAKDLLIEFNGAPMANQHLSEEEARAILEYFRTL
ncbi:cytochrome c [Formosa haliotis]|uniref:cytochrome c n=1 Tax=Formosa haliotis TaxID=1555194 RepID=UPI00082691C0|nr:cytochrome c [Formosa haliotis]